MLDVAYAYVGTISAGATLKILVARKLCPKSELWALVVGATHFWCSTGYMGYVGLTNEGAGRGEQTFMVFMSFSYAFTFRLAT